MQNAAWNHGGQSQSAHHPKNFMTKAHTTTAELAGIGQGGAGRQAAGSRSKSLMAAKGLQYPAQPGGTGHI